MTGAKLAKGATGGTRKKFLFRRDIRRASIDDAIRPERLDGVADDSGMQVVDYLTITKRLGNAVCEVRFDGIVKLRAERVLHIAGAVLGGD